MLHGLNPPQVDTLRRRRADAGAGAGAHAGASADASAGAGARADTGASAGTGAGTGACACTCAASDNPGHFSISAELVGCWGGNKLSVILIWGRGEWAYHANHFMSLL